MKTLVALGAIFAAGNTWKYGTAILKVIVEERIIEKRSLLHITAIRDMKYAVKFLLFLGADVDVMDPSYDATPLNMAANEGCKEAVAILIKNGADVNTEDSFGNTAPKNLYKSIHCIETLAKQCC